LRPPVPVRGGSGNPSARLRYRGVRLGPQRAHQHACGSRAAPQRLQSHRVEMWRSRVAGRELSHRNQGSTAGVAARTRIVKRLIIKSRALWAGLVALLALACYQATLLPGLDFGDSASFQSGVGFLTLTPRQAYPLYYALGNVF